MASSSSSQQTGIVAAGVELALGHATTLLGKECTDTLFRKFDLSSTSCLTLLLSKLIGVGVIAGSSIVKVPQIVKILGARSVAGLSLLSILLETLGYALSFSYNYRSGNPFSTYGESVFTFAQDLVILALIFAFTDRFVGLFASLGIFGGLLYVFLTETIVPFELLKLLYSFNIVLLASSRLPQIYSNFANGNTGQLSAITIFLYFFGALARVGTTLKEINDPLILAGFGVSALLNGILAAQIVLYWSATKAFHAKKQTKKE